MTKVVLDHDLCEANGVCVRIAPDVFELDQQERLHLKQVEPDPSHADAVRRAVRDCPKGALSLQKDED